MGAACFGRGNEVCVEEDIQVVICAGMADVLISDLTCGLSQEYLHHETTRTIGLTPLAETILTVSLALPGLGYAVDLCRKKFRKGIVIVATRKDVIIRVDRRLPRGTIVVRSKDGDVTISSESNLTEALKAIGSAMTLKPR